MNDMPIREVLLYCIFSLYVNLCVLSTFLVGSIQDIKHKLLFSHTLFVYYLYKNESVVYLGKMTVKCKMTGTVFLALESLCKGHVVSF